MILLRRPHDRNPCDSRRMASTRQVADAIGCDKDTAYRRLRSLSESGVLDKQDSVNTLLWTISEDDE